MERRSTDDKWTSTTTVITVGYPDPDYDSSSSSEDLVDTMTKHNERDHHRTAPAVGLIRSCEACAQALKCDAPPVREHYEQEYERCRRTRRTGLRRSADPMEGLQQRLRKLRQQDNELEQKLELEMKMRDGVHKLLAASRHPLHQLAAAKTLLTSTERMLLYMSKLQKLKTEQVLAEQMQSGNSHSKMGNHLKSEPNYSKGKLSVSDIRIPLMWKDFEAFQRVKTDSRKWAVFCLVKCGSEVYDTEMNSDISCTSTDITFTDNIIFAEADPHFELKLEVYAHLLPTEDEGLLSTSKKLRQKMETVSRRLPLSHSMKIGGLISDDLAITSGGSEIAGPRFTLLGSSVLIMPDICDETRTHDLKQEKSNAGENQNNLSLFGHFCCRLAAQPNCLTQDVISSYLNFQSIISGQPSWLRLYCVLRGDQLFCYNTVSDAEKRHIPKYNIHVCKDTEIHIAENSSKSYAFHVLTTNKTTKNRHVHTLSASTAQEMSLWLDKIEKHIQNLEDWRQASDTLMEIKDASNSKQHNYNNQSIKRSSYDEMCIDTNKPKYDVNKNADKYKVPISQMLHHAVLREAKRNQVNSNHHNNHRRNQQRHHYPVPAQRNRYNNHNQHGGELPLYRSKQTPVFTEEKESIL